MEFESNDAHVGFSFRNKESFTERKLAVLRQRGQRAREYAVVIYENGAFDRVFESPETVAPLRFTDFNESE